MKDIWCLACSLGNRSLKTVKKYYSKRWSTECSYRDEKDFYSGIGVYKSRIKSVQSFAFVDQGDVYLFDEKSEIKNKLTIKFKYEKVSF